MILKASGIWGSGLDTLLTLLRSTIDTYGREAFPVEELEAESFEENLAEILDERDNSHNFLVSTLQENDLPGELFRTAKLIRY